MQQRKQQARKLLEFARNSTSQKAGEEFYVIRESQNEILEQRIVESSVVGVSSILVSSN